MQQGTRVDRVGKLPAASSLLLASAQITRLVDSPSNVLRVASTNGHKTPLISCDGACLGEIAVTNTAIRRSLGLSPLVTYITFEGIGARLR